MATGDARLLELRMAVEIETGSDATGVAQRTRAKKAPVQKQAVALAAVAMREMVRSVGRADAVDRERSKAGLGLDDVLSDESGEDDDGPFGNGEDEDEDGDYELHEPGSGGSIFAPASDFEKFQEFLNLGVHENARCLPRCLTLTSAVSHLRCQRTGCSWRTKTTMTTRRRRRTRYTTSR
jgi:hypothetical protein